MEHLNALLDEALQETFPASDPIAVSVERCPPVATEAEVAGKQGPASRRKSRK